MMQAYPITTTSPSEKKAKPRRGLKKVILCFACLYLLVIIGATIYGQTVYYNKLPAVRIGVAEKGRLPASAVTGSEEQGYSFYTVEQIDGPWGKNYILRQTAALNFKQLDDNTVFVLESMNLKSPIALSMSTPAVYDGMRVRLIA